MECISELLGEENVTLIKEDDPPTGISKQETVAVIVAPSADNEAD
jgi:hypothetical protein